MKYFSRSNHRGFTLIELLVVIAIIAILAAILFPVFAKAREKARQTACLSNEKQIGVGLIQYEQNYDETLPYFFYAPPTLGAGPSNPASGLYKWMDAAYPYIKSEAVFNCPDDTGKYPYIYYKNLKAASNTNYGSYGMNVMYRHDDHTKRTPPSIANGLNISQLAAPATTVWLADITSGPNCIAFGFDCVSAGAGCSYPQPNPIVDTTVTPHQINIMVARHTDFVNILFCDGHSKAMTLDSLAAKRAADGQTLSYFTIEDD